VGSLQANDAPAARDVYVKGLLGGAWTPDDSRWILHMQDDPTELLGLIKEANARPDVGRALKAMLDQRSAAEPPDPDRPWLKELYPAADTGSSSDGSDPEIAQDTRARTRDALGEAADAMSDEDIDRVIEAARAEDSGDESPR
jgi:hypothetical protein